MFYRLFLIIVILISSGCSNTQHQDCVITVLDEYVLQYAKPLDNHQNIIGSYSDDEFIFVYNDSIVISINSTEPKSERSVVEFSKKGHVIPFISKFEYGRLPSQLLSAMPYLYSDTLIVQDVVKGTFTIISLPNILTSSEYQPQIITSDILTNCILPYKGVVLYLSPYWMDYPQFSLKKLGPKFLLTNNEYQECHKYGRFITTNVNRGSIISNYQANRILFFDDCKDLVEVYDYDLNLIKKIVGPEKICPEYSFPDKSEIQVPVIVNDIYNAFIPCTITCSESFVFAAYIGKSMNKTYILKFDWDGNLIDSFYTEHEICTLSATKNGNLYASVYASDTTLHLINYEYE